MNTLPEGEQALSEVGPGGRARCDYFGHLGYFGYFGHSGFSGYFGVKGS
ncbi:hypothetical protein [Streptomyces venezuelae]